MMQFVLRWIFCTNFGCVREITTALHRVLFSAAFATLEQFQPGVTLFGLFVCRAVFLVGVGWELMGSGKTDSVW
jgi:hypothetical protein